MCRTHKAVVVGKKLLECNVHLTLYRVEEELDVEGYGLKGTIYVRRITLNASLEQVEIVVLREAPTWE